MTIRELIKELVEYDLNQEVEICCYTWVNDPNEMIIYDEPVDKNGNNLCQIRKEITLVCLETDKITVCIS